MIFDLVFVIVIGLAFWWGYQKGVIHSIFALLVYFFGVLGAVRFSYLLIKYLKQWTGLSQKPLAVIAFILMFLLMVLLVRIVEWLLEYILQKFSLNAANKIAGGVLHTLVGLYLFCVLLWYGKGFNIVPKDQREMSHVYRYISGI
ncbi:MAG TPA: CvpA family protein, partial [Chitinophagales bacterium]